MIKLEFPAYSFPTVNRLMRMHWAERSKVTKFAANQVAVSKLLADATDAMGCRRVTMSLTKPKGRLRDADNCWKTCLDALVANGLLIDDSPTFCVLGEVTQTTGPLKTVITLEEHLNGR